MRLLAAALLALVLAGPASAADTRNLTQQRAERIFLANHKVADWLARYPERGRTVDAEYRRKTDDWEVQVWWGSGGEIAKGLVEDRRGTVIEAWTGPQVAWKMARGYPGAFAGKTLNSVPVWLALCAAFLLGLADLRRPLALRNLDLLVLLSFSISLRFFNGGDIFTSAPLAYPPLLYLLARMVWIGFRARPGVSGRPVWPVWVLAAATVFLVGFRIGLNVTQRKPNVIDVGYSGVIGAHRIVNGQSPYGHFPLSDPKLKACGEADADGDVRDRVQTNGRCEAANERGDTYGPVAYLAYVPAYLLFGWGGKWDSLPTAHATAIAFDLAALVLLGLVGLRFGGYRLGVTLAFAWASYPFTQYVLSSNTNDAIPPALLLLGFLFLVSAWARGASAALAGWTKFGSLLVVPLWSGYPRALEVRSLVRFAAGFVVASAAAFSILLLEPDVLHAARLFWDRTFGWQLGRDSPFSIWGWGQYHAGGVPDLALVQKVVIALVGLGALALAFVPRRRTPLTVAALTAAVLIGFQLTLTHWFYLYIPWFFPFVVVAVLAPRPARTLATAEVEQRDRPSRELVAAG
ncbi:MAG: hypothetical protein ACJ75P_05640 [Gaiellaceae bacterium]